MDNSHYWHTVTNPETGAKFEHWELALRAADNGHCDYRRLLDSEYGAILAQRGERCFRFEEDPMGEACLAYYHSVGVKKEMHRGKDFYERWAIFTPEKIRGAKLPVIFWNHGGANAIEVDEFAAGLTEMTAREQFILVMAQNTNWQSIGSILDQVLARYPADPERVYITGFSQGSQTAVSAVTRMPLRFAGVAPCGGDILLDVDNLDQDYTIRDMDRMTCARMPMIMINAQFDQGNYVPLNKFRPRLMRENRPRVSLYRNPAGPYDADPTNPPGGPAKRRRPEPREGCSADVWKLNRLNMKLLMLGCQSRDIPRCLEYWEHPDTELHHIAGFYGDREEIREYAGWKHYLLDIDNYEGLPIFRYVVVENTPHWPMNFLGELTWEFFRRFRRDSATGKILLDPYVTP